jgi:hypothetical protein
MQESLHSIIAPVMAHRFTIGVEEEFQIVDPETWELRSHVSELLASTTSLGGSRRRCTAATPTSSAPSTRQRCRRPR